jgi:hypothetical protein
LIVAADKPAEPSTNRTTFSAPTRGPRCCDTNAITSRAVTSTGSFATTVKNTFKSWAYALTVFGRTRAPTNSKNPSINP